MPSQPVQEIIVRAIITQNRHLLVNQTQSSVTGQNYCALPGGHVEPGEDCILALKRELQEELAMDVTVGEMCFVIEHRYASHNDSSRQRHELTLYFAAAALEEISVTSDKISSPEPTKNFRWLPYAEIDSAALLPQISGPLLQKYFSHQRFSPYVFQDSTSAN